jgi:hypothetical protein
MSVHEQFSPVARATWLFTLPGSENNAERISEHNAASPRAMKVLVDETSREEQSN